ncbi:MAG: class I SAM-dependent methyltransferase [Acidobacteria bacterium]|nr:class I SAM-dependent methyltransferase [Acidobacteriota bacterium]
MTESMPRWFENWFNEDYLTLYRHRDLADAGRQIALILSTLKLPKNARILDLGCGEGRHLEFLHQLGIRAFGIDLSPVLIGRGKAQFPYLSLAVGDMRKITGKFDLILSLFTSFGYFDDDSENMSVFLSVSQALTPGGTFWLDFLNPDYVRKNLKPETVREPEPGLVVTEKRRIEKDMVIKEIVFSSRKGGKHYEERVKLYGKDRLESMLRDAGLEPAGSFGDYDGRKWSPDMPRTILFAEKRGG